MGIIINELLTNIFKYAFPGEKKGTVIVSLETKGNRVIMIVQDNGVGIDDKLLESRTSGFGLTLVKMLADQLKGTYNITNENGTKSVLEFER